jgi:hypothetical protein
MADFGRRAARTGVLIVMLTLPWGAAPSNESRQVVAQSSCFVTVADGDIQGANLGPACAFLGIPFGATTEGGNRWRAPQPPVPWAGVLNATGAPLQPAGCANVAFFGTTPSFGGSENCLILNIWARNPLPETPAPVLVATHRRVHGRLRQLRESPRPDIRSRKRRHRGGTQLSSGPLRLSRARRICWGNRRRIDRQLWVARSTGGASLGPRQHRPLRW